MRISTNTLYEMGTSSMQSRQSELSRTQQQLATGKRVLTPADDPIAAARAIEVTQSQQVNKSYQSNAGTAQSSLALQDSTLANVTSLIQDVKALTVNAGNGVLTASELNTIATELDGRYQELLGLANSNDGNGQFLFSGYQGSTRPFAEVAPGSVAYYGDQGTRQIQISASRRVAVSDSGADIFQRIKNGNGTFASASSAANNGTGAISVGSVVDRSALTGHNYAVNFSVSGNTTTYDIVDTTTSTNVVTAAAYVAGNSITVAGMQVEVRGQPANGDAFTLQPASNVSLFKTLSDLGTALKGATSGGAGNTKLNNLLTSANQNLDNALNNVLTVRASLGVRMQEADHAQASAADLDTQYEGMLSKLQDLDYTQAISDLDKQQVVLQAAQQSFMKLTSLSLFDLLR